MSAPATSTAAAGAEPARSDARLGWADLVVLLCSGPCTAIIFVAVAPVLPAMAAQFTAFDGALLAQLIMTLPGLGIIAGGPAAGWWAERVGVARVLRVSLTVYALAGAAGLVLSDAFALMASRFVLGVAAGGIATSTTAMISECFDGAGRARMLGYQTAVASATAVIAILGSGLVAELSGWRAPFALYPLLAAPLLLLALRPLPGTAMRADPQVVREPLPAAVWHVLLAVVLLFAAAFMTGAQAAFLLASDGVRSPMLMSLIIGAASLGNALGAAAFGRCMARLGTRFTIVLSLGLLAAGLATMGLTHTPPFAAAGCLVAGLGSGLAGPWIAARLFDRTPALLRPRVAGLLYAAIFIGDFLNPLMVNVVQRGLGLHGTFVAVAAVLLVVAVWQSRRA